MKSATDVMLALVLMPLAALRAAGDDFGAGRGGYAWLKDKDGGRIHSIQNDTDEALRFLQSRPKDKPFFLQVAYTVPVPETAAKEYWLRLPTFFREAKNKSRIRWAKRFDTPEKYQSDTKDYYRLISEMDRSSGVILDALQTAGIANNTIVVFTGNNGYFPGEHGLADKWYAYDDWVLNVNFALTFCALAGVTPPAAMQGRNLTPLLKGPAPADWRSEIIPASEGVRSKDWKYIRWIVSGIEELFDRRSDPRETHNLATDPPSPRGQSGALERTLCCAEKGSRRPIFRTPAQNAIWRVTYGPV